MRARRSVLAVRAGGERARVADLLALLERPVWMAQAACRGQPKHAFFPTRGESTRPAKALCGTCTVRVECLDYALAHETFHRDGIWDGTGPTQRGREAARRQEAG